MGGPAPALADVVRAGRCRPLGHPNSAAWQVADAAWTARTDHLTPFVSAQNRYNLLTPDAEQELVPACLHFGLGLLPFYPLASGLITGKYRRRAAAQPANPQAHHGTPRRLC